MAGELGNGLVTGIPRGGTIPQALASVQRGADRTGRKLENFCTSALVNLLMLDPGYKLTDDHVIAQCGSSIMVNVHFAVELVKEAGCEPPRYVQPIWEEDTAFHESRPAELLHQQLHASHYSYLDPEEARFVAPDLTKNFWNAGQSDKIVDQLRDLEKQGLNAMSFVAPEDQHCRLFEDLLR